jgi:nickel/cobalt transporter (NicO) family protein
MRTRMRTVCTTHTIIFIRMVKRKMNSVRRRAGIAGLCMALCAVLPASRADTVASLLGNFTVNQYCGLKIAATVATLHYVVVYGQLPALAELHRADADGNGVTTQSERDVYVGGLAQNFADKLQLLIDGVAVPLHAIGWSSTLPTEQSGFSLRVDVDFSAIMPVAAAHARHDVSFTNQNYAGRIGWHEIVVQSDAGIVIFDTNAYADSLTGGLREALQSLPPSGALDERSVQFSFGNSLPSGATAIAARPPTDRAVVSSTGSTPLKIHSVASESTWIATQTRRLVDSISGPRIEPRIAFLALLGALLLGAVHALSPGHGKTIVGAYLIGSRGTPRHAAFLGLTVTVTHTLGVFVLGFVTLYASRYIVPERLFPILSSISAALVLGMGIMLLSQRMRAARQMLSRAPCAPAIVFQALAPGANSGPRRSPLFVPHQQAALGEQGAMHSHGGVMHSHLPPGAAGESITWRSLLTLGISGGLVPCPSAMVLLLAAVALNKTAYGMLLVIAFSIGLAITLTAIGMVFLYARNRFRSPKSGARLIQLLPVLSAAAITVIGIGLCIAAVKSFA